MALIKETQIKNYPITASYWKVGMLTIDTNLKEANFSFNLYFEKTDEPNAFVESICITDLIANKDKTMFEEYFGKDCHLRYKDWQTSCYEYAKKYVPEFNDATDDPDEILMSQTKQPINQE